MDINIPPRARFVIYVATGLISPVMAYLLAKHYIGQLEMALWTAETVFVNAMAASKVNQGDK